MIAKLLLQNTFLVGIEEPVLLAGLPGYADYAPRVRYRLVPGVW